MLWAKFQAILADMTRTGIGGMTATVMTPDGTWSGATGKADGVLDLQIDSQFGIGSVTKSIVAAQVMQLVEAGEVQLDAPATEGVSGVGVGKLGSNFGYIASAGCLTDEDPVIFVVLTNWRTGHGPELATLLVRAALSD